MNVTGLAVVVAVVFIVLAFAHIVGWLLALVVAVVAVLLALLAGGVPSYRRRL